ncbi:MAG: 4-hydroxythreonine-4-phosphate dehydrogenase PdxA [Mariprofundaceae bacterium]
MLTLGEPAGIGPDCVLRLWERDPAALRDCVIVAPAAWLEARARQIGMAPRLARLPAPEAMPSAPDTLAVVEPATEAHAPVQPGRPSPGTAGAVVECIRQAARWCIQGRAAGMVTGPIEKAVLRETGFRFPGHTEFLAHLAGDVPFAMMLANRHLRVSLLTTHLALAEVPAALSSDATLTVIRTTHTDLIRRFGIARPRLALCGLNPHAGENGHFGDEEARILMPAIRQAHTEGIKIEGPLPADALFAPAQRQRFDAIIACYHDQGLIPVKALGFGETVNITLGLPFIRTSVDHGTALALAGKPGVDPNSLGAAIEMARDMAANRQAVAA